MKFVRTGPGGHKLQDILKDQKVSSATVSLLKEFIEKIDNRLSSRGIYYKVHTHTRGLTYFPTDEDRPKAFWINFAQDWFTIAYTDKDGQQSKRVFDDNLEKMLGFAEGFFNIGCNV
ncbi:hypothetical protein ACFL36_01410 [Thermodesulfobacteriota bacterium]